MREQYRLTLRVITSPFMHVCVYLNRKKTSKGSSGPKPSVGTTWCTVIDVGGKLRRPLWVFKTPNVARTNVVKWTFIWPRSQYCLSYSAYYSGVIQECEMVESPQILTLVVKRFNFDPHSMSSVKSDCIVAVPPVLQTQVSNGVKSFSFHTIDMHDGKTKESVHQATLRKHKRTEQ